VIGMLAAIAIAVGACSTSSTTDAALTDVRSDITVDSPDAHPGFDAADGSPAVDVFDEADAVPFAWAPVTSDGAAPACDAGVVNAGDAETPQFAAFDAMQPYARAYLSHVFALSPCAVWVSDGLQVWNWNGMTWSSVYSPTGTGIQAIWASAVNDVWVLDSDRVVHWDGANWVSMNLPGVFQLATLMEASIWGFSPNDVWIATPATMPTSTHSLGAHWDGTSWTLSDLGIDSRMSGLRQPIWGSAPNDVWTASGSQVSHWDGHAWTPTPLDCEYALGIDGTGPDDVWYLCGVLTGTRLWHWTGTWTSVDGDADIRILWADRSSPGVWTMSLYDIFHYAGGSWSTYGLLFDRDRAPVPVMQAVSGTSAADVWLVGQMQATSPDYGLVMHGSL
jgi:hypothetical protein